jgi:predicted acyltransferase
MSTVYTGEAAREKSPLVGGRLMSLDVLRGFDMFWIIGADSIVRGLRVISDDGVPGFFVRQFEHVRWEGFVFYDLIFPLFVFMIGMSLVLSLDKMVAKDGKGKAYARILRRSFLLFLLGVIYDDGVASIYDENVLCGVLQRLALCYFFTSLLYINLKPKALLALVVVVLIAYYILLCFVPVPGVGEVSLIRDAHWPAWVDEHTPPYYDFDPENYLGTVTAVCSCILGVFAGLFLRDSKKNDTQKVLILIVGGIALTIVGYLWGFHFPIVKRMWTSSYVLVAGGYSFALLGIFYWIIDVLQVRWWVWPFVWIGTNPLALYMANFIVDWDRVGSWFVGGPVAAVVDPYGQLLIAAAGLFFTLVLAWFLYTRKIFLRL